MNRRVGRGWTVAVLGPVLASAGCVHYVPVDMAELQPKEEVHVRVNQDGAVQMMQHLGQFAQEVRANVEPQGPDSTAITIWVGRNYVGTPFEDVHQTIVLPRSDINALLRRELSVWRTAVTAAGLTVAFVWATDRIFQWLPNRHADEEVPPPPGDDGGPSFTRIAPGWSFRIPLGFVP